MRTLRRLLPLAVLAALAGPVAGPASPLRAQAAATAPAQTAAPTVVIVVRHAEKQAQGSDPELTPEGAARAGALVRALEDAGVTAVYSSQFRRTADTGRPLAERLGFPVTVFPVQQGTDYPAALAADVLAKHRGQTVAVVSHSNTVPQIVKALSGRDVPEITDPEYDHLFVVVIPATGPARVIKASYGARTAPGQPAGASRMQERRN